MSPTGFLIIFVLLFPQNVFSQGTQRDFPDMPEFQGITQWFNSPPLTKESLKGKIVLVDFWTYTCINCIRTLPFLKTWYQKYKDQGFVVIGVHSPEFQFERDPANVKKAIEHFKIPYPVALDSSMATWTAYQNEAWPAHYFIDAQGKIRHVHLGEGNYEESERWIQELLKQKTEPLHLPSNVDFSQIQSPETYLGTRRREHWLPANQKLDFNQWTYEGFWQSEPEKIVLTEGRGKIRFHFKATKVNLVLHPGRAPVSAIVRLDGQIVDPQKSGKDVHQGKIEISEPRLYELIYVGPKGEEHTVEIEFLSPGVAAYAFTFG